MSRRIAREVAMKLLYEREIAGEEQEESLNMLEQEFALEDKDKEYINDILDGTKHHQEEIDNYISEYAIGWSIRRIAKVDLAILRLALYEIRYRDDIPSEVSINEAVELAKRYGNQKSGSFVNGILGNFVRSRHVNKEEEPEKV
jgi:transcription antitermination factor NusB